MTAWFTWFKSWFTRHTPSDLHVCGLVHPEPDSFGSFQFLPPLTCGFVAWFWFTPSPTGTGEPIGEPGSPRRRLGAGPRPLTPAAREYLARARAALQRPTRRSP